MMKESIKLLREHNFPSLKGKEEYITKYTDKYGEIEVTVFLKDDVVECCIDKRVFNKIKKLVLKRINFHYGEKDELYKKVEKEFERRGL